MQQREVLTRRESLNRRLQPRHDDSHNRHLLTLTLRSIRSFFIQRVAKPTAAFVTLKRDRSTGD